jgi:transcription initiation factor TFIID subunit TAF12
MLTTACLFLLQHAFFFGDAAFGRGEHMQCMYKNVEGDAQKEQANEVMAKVRVAVEWGFGDVYNLFPRLNVRSKQHLFQTLPGLQLQIGFFLANCRNCCHANQVAQQFKGQRPTLEHYVAETLQQAKEMRDADAGGLFVCQCCP